MFNFKNNYNIDDLVEIVKVLRSENGCPWDKQQSHESIKPSLIEEAYEVIEAIDMKSPEMLREELGDLLLQVVFHCQLETEKDSFNFENVCDEICKKLIIRHPHVFSDVTVSDCNEVLNNWESIKQHTKGQTTYTETLKSVPKTFPALMKAQKIGKRAAKSGMDFESLSDALAKLKSEISELDEAVRSGNTEDMKEELGDVLFSCTNVARKIDADAEQLLTDATEKFISRFEKTESLVRLQEIDMKSLSIEELDAFWDQAKAHE